MIDNMPIIKDKYRRTVNTDKPFAIEATYYYGSFSKSESRPYTNIHKKYRTEYDLLRALSDLRKMPCLRGHASTDGGKTYFKILWKIKPVHVNYEI